jgi:hypothetical protein
MRSFYIIISLLILASCSKEDELQSTPIPEYLIMGKWHQKEMTINNVTFPYDDHEPCGKDYIEFYETNKIRSIDVWNCIADVGWIGTFSKSNNALTINNGTINRTVEITELTSNSLVYKYEYDEDNNGVLEHYIEKFER